MGDAGGAGTKQERERAFFDEASSGVDPALLPPREYAPYVTRFEDAVLEAAEPVDGLTVVDLGCGIGDLSLRLLSRGARVTAIDISEVSTNIARRRWKRFLPDTKADFRAAPAEQTGLPDESVDLVVGNWVLHHLDLPKVLPELRRIMRPGARGVFTETSGLNPGMRLARRLLLGKPGVARYGTPDERPLTPSDVDLISRFFPDAELDHPNVVLFHLLDRHMLRWRWPTATDSLKRIDAAIERGNARRIRRLSYYLRVTFSKPLTRAATDA